MAGAGDRAVSPESPVREIEPEGAAGVPEHGIALCLSGGGYRAMVFHVGVLWRLNWGYAVCDAALRRHVQPTIPRLFGFPYPGTGV